MSDPFNVIFALVRTNRDFTARQVAILRLCQTSRREADRQVKELSATLGISKPVTSRAADKLEDEGYLTRSIMGEDRRTCVLTLTAAGKKLMSDIASDKATRAAA